MNITIFLSIGLLVIVLVVAVAFLLGLPINGKKFSGNTWQDNMRNIVQAQRFDAESQVVEKKVSGRSIKDTIQQEQGVEKEYSGKVSLRKRLQFADMRNTPMYVLGLAMVVVSLVVFLLVRLILGNMVQMVCLFSGPLVVNWYINRRINGRVDKFDSEFPQFLLSLAGLLKTGINPGQALVFSAENLGENSLLKTEIQLMVERMRVGVPEERSIGSFAEDINHPEIELFVQAFLLNRRLGGNLSDALDRLARQVRKRQFFRQSARASIAMQKGSMWIILGILIFIQGMLFFMMRDTVVNFWTCSFGQTVGQIVILMILLAIYWMNQVTKIRT